MDPCSDGSGGAVFMDEDEATASREKGKAIMSNPRYVMLIGSIREEFPDLPECPDDGAIILWDRQLKRAVVTVHKEYAQAICLEAPGAADAPFSNLQGWFNDLSNEAAVSEGLTPTEPRFYEHEF